MNERAIRELLKKRNQVSKLMEQGRYEKVVESLKKCSRQWNESPVYLTDLATAYARLFDFKNAEACVDQLLQKHGNDNQVISFSGDLLASIRQTDRAMDVYGKLLGPKKDDPASGLRVATLLERQGRLDEASELLERVLHRDPTSEGGRLLHAVLLTRTKSLDKAGQELFDLLSSGLKDREVHWKAGHQLASVLDKQDNFSDASQVLVATKLGMQNDYAAEVKAARQGFEAKCSAIRELTNSITAADVASWRVESDDFPVALLAGHPRSGTTLLESILDRHSGLVSAEETTCMEEQVFRSVYGVPAAKPELFNLNFLNQRSAPQIKSAQDLYLKAIRQVSPSATEQKLILDKNPMLTHFMAVAQRFFPSMKSLVALRDPRAVCLSCFQQSVGVSASNVSWLNIEDTMKSYNDIMGVWLRMKEILPDGWLEVRYEDLVDDTEVVARRVVDFLGLDWKDEIMQHSSSQRTIFSPTYVQAAQPIYRSALDRWKSYDDLLGPHLDILQPSVDAFGY